METRTTRSSALSSAAHDLNNLSATILGFAVLVADSMPADSELAAYLTEIQASAEGVAAIAERLRLLVQDPPPFPTS